MSWAKQHPVEAIVEWIAPIPLALAVAWTGLRLGLSLVEAAAASIAALTAGFAVMRFVGRHDAGMPFAFEPVEVEPIEVEAGVLLLDEADEILELDDPLTEIASDSRVVQLFARPDPTPGELVERIADFLGDGRRPMPAGLAEEAKPVDASATLQAALANIRASLR